MDGKQIHQALYEAATHHRAGRIAEAEALYRKVLASSRDNPEANHNLGVLAMQSGKGLDQALPYFQRAWEADPAHQQHWLSYLRALQQAGEATRAQAVFADGRKRGLNGPAPTKAPARQGAPPHQAKKTRPAAGAKLQRQVDAVWQLLQAGQIEPAIEQARALCNAHPAHPGTWKVFGAALQRAGHQEQAAKALRQSHTLSPDDGDVIALLSRACYALGQYAEAESLLRPLLAREKDNADAAEIIARCLLRLYRPAEAETVCIAALERHPQSGLLTNCLAQSLLVQNRDKEAISAFQRAHALAPKNLESYFALQRLYREHEQHTEQLRLCESVMTSAPEYAGAQADKGAALLRMGDVEAAAEALDAAIERQPDDLASRSNWLFCENYLQRTSPAQRFEQAVAYGTLAAQRAVPFARWQHDPAPTRLRVGLVSGDLRNHPVGYFLHNLLAHTADTKIEWFGYATHTARDTLTDQLKSHCAGWTVIAGLDAQDAASRIHADGLHILIDLSGHTAHHALPVFAWKPAPLQLAWLGYFATTGIAEIDYLLMDDVSMGAGQQAVFTERLWPLPESRLCFTPPPQAPPVAPAPCLHNGHITFGCFQNLRKISDEVLALWGSILREVPTARLRLQNSNLGSDTAQTRLSERALAAGIPVERLSLHPPTDRHDYFAAHEAVDVLLDTFPFPGGTTTCEALWMGVPTITLRGESFLERQGASLLCAAGLADWVTDTRDGYKARAIQAASETGQLASLRGGLRDRLSQRALFHGGTFAQQFDSTLWELWEHYRRGETAVS